MRKTIVLFVFFLFILAYVSYAQAQGDFMLQPAKIEISLRPGEQAERVLYVTNRLGVPARFSLSVEDIEGSSDRYDGARLSGSGVAARYFDFEATEFALLHGERARIPVIVRVPLSVSPGEIVAAVMISGSSQEREAGSTQIASRIGALFFIRIEGDVKEEGMLRNFTVMLPTARVMFENTGNVHLNPYGVMEVQNTLTRAKKIIPIDPWFVLPGSTRARDIILGDSFSWGRYSARLLLNRGYANIIDTKTVVLWVLPLPWQTSGFFILILLGVIGFYKYIFRLLV